MVTSKDFRISEIIAQISLLCQGVNAQERNKAKIQELEKELEKLRKEVDK